MKLQPIIFPTFNTPPKQSLLSTRLTNPIPEEKEKYNINNHFYPPSSFINFQANPTEILQKELRTLKNIHCPTCGTRILNHDEFIKASKDVLLINNTEDYLAFINKYRSAINPAFKNIINSMQKYIKREPEKSIKDIATLVKSNYISKFRQSIHTLTKDYKNQTFFSEENFGYKEGILTLQKLEQNPDFRLFITSLQNIIKDFPAELKQQYYEKYLNLLRETIIEMNAFNFNKGSGFTIVQNLCQNFLKLSSGKTTKMFKNSPAEIDILSCKGCADFFHANYAEVKKNKDFMFQYINDVAEQVVNNNALSQKEYPLLLLSNAKKYLKIIPTDLNPALNQLNKKKQFEQTPHTQH